MTGAERRARQAAIEREFHEDQQTRPNRDTYTAPPPTDSPGYCSVSRSGRHSCWTSKKDGKRRCYFCCGVFDGTGPTGDAAGPPQPAPVEGAHHG